MSFFTYSSFELCDRHLIDECHLALDPVAECIDWKGVGIENYQFVGIDFFANGCEVLYEIIEYTFMINE
jgi:hypothetical protein